MLLTRFIVLAIGASLASAALAAPSPYRPDVATLQLVPRHELPADALGRAFAEASAQPSRDRFAVRVPLGLTPAHGLWDKADDNTARWRLRLHSPGAVSMSAHLDPVTLPPGARLFVYGADGQNALGPFTQAHVQKSGYWTPVVNGDELVLEVLVPPASAKDFSLKVADGFHGYREFAKLSPQSGTAGACNRDVACTEGLAWTNEWHSAALITIGNVAYCSGQLVNNTEQDFKPYFLTARHCGIGHENGPDSSVNFYFNYQAAICGGPAPTTYDLVQGSTLLADDIAADFALVRITTSTTALPSNAYFAGWDAMGSVPASNATGAAFHHPSGDDTKISQYDSIQQSTVNIGAGCPIDAWQVHWASGTTEEGSSGGGLWDGASHAVIGVLSGGGASCTSKDAPDYFARLDRMWTANPGNNGQLKAWLSPTGNCVAKVPGLANGSSSPGQISATATNVKCDGVASICGSGGGVSTGGGGGSAGSLLYGLLAGLALRARRRSAPDDQEHSADRDE